MRAREPRRKVRFKARMRGDRGWADVTIRDLSSRGMLLSMETPPAVGSYVEICGPSTTLIARAVWVKGEYFGVRTQDRIDIDSLIGGGKSRAEAAPTVQLRSLPRRSDHEASHAASRLRGSLMEYGGALILILAGAATLAILIHSLFAAPMQAISEKLAP